MSDQSQTAQQEDEVVEDDYQALSSKEESDLELLMRDCHAAIGNAEAFSEQLSKQLSVLDGVRAHQYLLPNKKVWLKYSHPVKDVRRV